MLTAGCGAPDAFPAARWKTLKEVDPVSCARADVELTERLRSGEGLRPRALMDRNR